MNKYLFILFLVLWPNLMVNAVEIIYSYEGYPTIIHNEPLYFQIGEPKFWNLHVDTEEGEFINLDYRLAGDTLIQEKEYVRVVFGYEEKADLYENDFLLMSAIRPNGKNYADTLYYRQEEDKVYCLQQEEVILYGYVLPLSQLEVGNPSSHRRYLRRCCHCRRFRTTLYKLDKEKSKEIIH